jgi:membrane protease YdiL (CAAX protease family)
MPDVAAHPPLLVIVIEAVCWLAGMVLCVRLVTGRLGPAQTALPPWRVSLEGFITCALLVAACGFLLPHAVTYLSADVLGPAARDSDWWMMVQGAAFQSGMMAGALLGAFLLRLRKRPAQTPFLPTAPKIRQPLLGGVITFLISVPLIGGIGYAWKTLLDFLGHSASEQEMIDLFRNADDPALLGFMIVLAAVIAPVTEELIFRAGLYRYLRTRIPRATAFVVPSLIFAFLHGNLTALVPLFVLGVVFAYAYERTGSIAVPMIAHALFNLNTIVLVMAGVTG